MKEYAKKLLILPLFLLFAPLFAQTYGTCTGWATAFAARTIAESIAMNRTDQRQNTANVFSQIFAYKGYYSLRGINPTGQEGAVISYVLDFIRNEGAVKRPGFEASTNFPSIQLTQYANSRQYPILGYVRLFLNPLGAPGTVDERVVPVKKSLAYKKPVVIGWGDKGYIMIFPLLKHVLPMWRTAFGPSCWFPLYSPRCWNLTPWEQNVNMR